MASSDAKCRYKVGTLAKMVDAAANRHNNKHGVKWSHILHYLKAHCVVTDDPANLPFESPLQSYYVANDELAQELAPTANGHSILRTALPVAPLETLAALCHLGPSTLDHVEAVSGRMLLHTACRFPVTQQLESTLQLLISAHPAALLHRCIHGRTPLHYLLSYYADQRSPALASAFCVRLPEHKHIFYKLRQPVVATPPRLPEIPKPGGSTKIPYSAAIIPDAVTGCLPLHYAGINGASAEVVQVVYAAYPAAKHATDRNGRTPLHWYLGAGTLDWALPLTVAGEPLDHDARIQASDRSLDLSVLEILLSSRVARTTDAADRNPLHWAVTLTAYQSMLPNSNGDVSPSLLAVMQTLLDSYAGQCVGQDFAGMTPVVVLFDAVSKLQQRLWEKHHPRRRLAVGFTPPSKLMQMLLLLSSHSSSNNSSTTGSPSQRSLSSVNVAALEDATGRLPIHVALQVAANTETIQLLVDVHPACLVHTTDPQLLSPLHAAFACEWTAPLQTVDTVSVLLYQSYQAGKYGTMVDGRLAMKMEDSTGYYPIHYACHHAASSAVIELLVDRYPAAAMLQKPNGDLPVHCLIQDKELCMAAMTTTTALDSRQDEILAEARQKVTVLLRPLLSTPEKLKVAPDSGMGMLPLHIAVLLEAASYALLLRMLELYPESAAQFTSNLHCYSNIHDNNIHNQSGAAYSALDLHELCKLRKKNNKNSNFGHPEEEEWHHIRELLFSFSPKLESHRHRQELLDRCVRIVIDELCEYEWSTTTESHECGGGYHLQASQEKEGNPLDLEITHSVSAMEAAIQQCRRRSRRRKVSKKLAPNKSRHHPRHRIASSVSESSPEKTDRKQKPSNLKLKTSSSIYDDDDLGFHYDAHSYDDDEQEDDEGSAISYASGGGSGGESYTSGYDDQETGTDGQDTCGDETETRGSRSIYYTTTSGSRLQTTFEEGSAGESDSDSQTYSEESTLLSGQRRTFDDESTSASWRQQQRRGRRRRHRTFDDDDSTELSRRVTFEDDSTTVPPHEQRSYDNDDLSLSAGSIFEIAKQRAAAGEEKKDDDELHVKHPDLPSTPRAANLQTTNLKTLYERPSYMSEVGMRLWTFFVLYCDPNNPKDNYVDQLSKIFGEIKFSTSELMVSNSLPSYASNYHVVDSECIAGLCFRDIASPKCRELIYKSRYFLGKYDFGSDDDILVHRSEKDDSVVVMAYEWLFMTEKVTNARNPGMSEENIWATGEVPAEIGVTFQADKRLVWIKFTKNAFEYDNEVKHRLKLGVSVDDERLSPTVDGVIPILQHFNAISSERNADRMYSDDSKDMRFNSLNLLSGLSSAERKMRILIHEYPYAIVYPAPTHGTLLDYFIRYGVDSLIECNELVTQIAGKLEMMHGNGLCHGSVSMRNIVSWEVGSEKEACVQWGFMNLSFSSHIGEQRFLGGVDGQGLARFQTETLPPEMFVKLSSSELKKYTYYWKQVQKRFNVKIERTIIDPIIDLRTGATYVVKCHFIPLTTDENNIALPYELVPYDFSIDFWGLGQLLFVLKTGHTLFQSTLRDGRLVDYGDIFSRETEPLIYEHVRDSLAQDILLQLLANHETRKNLTVDKVLRHPFFCRKSANRSLAMKIAEERRHEGAAYQRRLNQKLHEASEKLWLEERTVAIHCWDFDLQERFHLSPSEIVRGLMTRKTDFLIPCSMVLLPYMTYNLTSTGIISELAECLGKELLHLGKACYVTSLIKQVTSSDQGLTFHKWSSSEMLRMLDLSAAEFGDILAEMTNLAARHIETFRHDPMAVASKLVQERVKQFLSCFDDTELFLCLVDEFNCTPIVNKCSPFAVKDEWRDRILQSGVPFMHLCSLYARGVSRGLSGLAQLIFQVDDAVVPPSWIEAARGLNHKLDELAMRNELNLLQDALNEMFSTQNRIGDNLAVMRDFLAEVDPTRHVGGMSRVLSADAYLWTTYEGVKELEEHTRSFTFKDALRNRRNDIKPTE